MQLNRRTICVLFVCGAVPLVTLALRPSALGERRSRAVQAQVESGWVDFTRVYPSEWDRVYFFPPYTSHEQIHQELGFHWADVAQTSIDQNDGVNLVVFVHGERVIDWFEHPRHLDLTELAVPGGFPKAAARFQVVRDAEGREILIAEQDVPNHTVNGD